MARSKFYDKSRGGRDEEPEETPKGDEPEPAARVRGESESGEPEGASGGGNMAARHAEERNEMHKRHEKERMDLHGKHRGEHRHMHEMHEKQMEELMGRK